MADDVIPTIQASIMDSVKKAVGFERDYVAFDLDFIMHINGVFSTLNQLGVGPPGGFSIEDNTATWDSFIGNTPNINFVKTLMYLKVRLLIDPPATSFALDAIKTQITELEWRLNVQVEGEKTPWTPKNSSPTTA